MSFPQPTPIYRLLHIDNLPIALQRGGLHAPNVTPQDGLPYHTIHNTDVQAARRICTIPCGPGGTVHDYIPFYFGYLSVMLLNLKTGRVSGYNEGQEPLIYLVSTAQSIVENGAEIVFSDGHGLAALTSWHDSLRHLDEIDWNIVCQRYWRDNDEDNDRQRRKQAEFLIHRFCDWSLIQEIGVQNNKIRDIVAAHLNKFSGRQQPIVTVRPEWYYF
jgi:hypothetical protein